MAASVPIIDIAALWSEDAAARRAVAMQVGAASASVGFFYVVGHGIARETIDAAVDAARRFFALPLQERLRIKVDGANRGYTPLFEATHPGQAPDANEGFEMGFEPDGTPPPTSAARLLVAPNRWPDLPDFRGPVSAYYDAALAASRRLLAAYALYFGLPEDFFGRSFTRPVANMRLAHYPAAPDVLAVSELGTGAHTDHGIITVLWQDDCGGLEVCLADGHGGDAQWVGVPPVPGSLVVNIGELMTRWTNGRLRSTLHRVVNRSGRDRFSMPLFVHPNADTSVDPRDLPGMSEIDAQHDPVISGDYLLSRFAAYRESWSQHGL